MNVLFTARWYFPHMGGGSIRTHHLAKGLVERGHNVDLLVHHPKSIDVVLEKEVKRVEKTPSGFWVHRLPFFSPRVLYWLLSVFLVFVKTVQLIEKKKIDVVVASNPPYIVGFPTILACRLTRTPYVVNVHDLWGVSHYSRLQHKIGSFLETLCLRFLSKKIVTTCQGFKDEIVEKYGVSPKRVYVVPNGVDEKKFGRVSLKQKQKMLARLGEPEGKIVLFVGKFVDWKGAIYAAEAFPMVCEKCPEALLVMAGDGPDGGKIKKSLEKNGVLDKAVFPGVVDYFDMPALDAVADVCLFPYPDPEEVGRRMPDVSTHTIPQFMASEKPIVAADLPGLRDLVVDKKTGLLFSAGDASDLAKKTIYLLKNPSEAKKLGKKARFFVLEDKKLSWDSIVSTLDEVLEKAARRMNR